MFVLQNGLMEGVEVVVAGVVVLLNDLMEGVEVAAAVCLYYKVV